MSGFIAPSLNYSLLAPILIVLGGALIGVLIEAFAPREKRAAIQLPITLITLVLSLVQVIRIRGIEKLDAAGSSVIWDGGAFLIQLFVLVIALLGTLLIADEKNFTSVASTLPGSQTRPKSFLPKSTSIKCSALSLGSASNSSPRA